MLKIETTLRNELRKRNPAWRKSTFIILCVKKNDILENSVHVTSLDPDEKPVRIEKRKYHLTHKILIREKLCVGLYVRRGNIDDITM